mgnify:CR=1 FL=1
MPESKDLKKIEKTLGKISQQQEEILTRLDRLEAAKGPDESTSQEALISFLDQFRSAEALGRDSLAPRLDETSVGKGQRGETRWWSVCALVEGFIF